MNTRTKHTTVTFTAPFSLSGVDEIQTPGDYAIAELHLADAIQNLVEQSRPTLSDDRSPKNP